MNDDKAAAAINGAVHRGLETYFDGCRARIQPFVKRHYHYPGAWATNKSAFGWDLLRSPLNLTWAPIYIATIAARGLCNRLGWLKLADRLRRVPFGITTDVQKHSTELIYRELLLWPTDTAHANPIHDAVVAELSQLSLSVDDDQAAQVRQLVGEVASDAIEQLQITRTASADISNASISTLIGAFAYKKFAPGGIAIGMLLAGSISRHEAIDSFPLGTSLGGFFYGYFPPDSSFLTVTASIALVMLVFAVLASFSGLLTDPLQALTGLHRRRLNKLIDKVEQDIKAKASGSFRPKDQYLARIFDLLDVLRSPFV